jgi:hypothetical protein
MAFRVPTLVFGSGSMRGLAATKMKLHADISRDNIATFMLEDMFADQ